VEVRYTDSMKELEIGAPALADRDPSQRVE
jgi:hypothetical protein